MSQTHTPQQVFQALAAALSNSDWETAAKLYAENVAVTNRFDPQGPTVRTGREAVREFFHGLGNHLDSVTVVDTVLTPAADPEVVTAEFALVAATTEQAQQFRLPAIFVLRVQQGLIIESHDYIGPRQP